MTGTKNFDNPVGQRVRIASSNGFALITALLAILVLTAVGTMAFVVTTQDVRISSRSVGEKKAFFAAEGGIHWLLGNFDPSNLANILANNVNVKVDPTNDPQSVYTINNITLPTQEPETLPLPGFSTGGIQEWGQQRYVARVTGTNTRYSSNVQIDLSLGYGPVEIMTAYR
jgi:hypothetical protein